MIKLIIFIIIVAKALPLTLNFTDHTDLFVFSLINCIPAVFSVLYSAIGSGFKLYIGLRFSMEKIFNCKIITFFCRFVASFVLFFVVGYLMIIFNLYYLENFMINPFNYSGFDVFIDVTPHLDIFNHPLCLFIIPLKLYHKLPDYYNYNIKSFSNFSHNSDINSNLDFSKINLNKDLRKIIGGGYLSYNNIESIGFVNDLLDNKPLLIKNLEKYLDNLETNKTYTLLPVIRWMNDDTGFSNSITVSNSLKIHKFVDKVLLAENISKSMRKSLHKYNLIQNNSEIVLMNRV